MMNEMSGGFPGAGWVILVVLAVTLSAQSPNLRSRCGRFSGGSQAGLVPRNRAFARPRAGAVRGRARPARHEIPAPAPKSPPDRPLLSRPFTTARPRTAVPGVEGYTICCDE